MSDQIKRAMVVEDEEALRDIIGEVLNILGIESIICESGAIAVESAESEGNEIDLFIIDLFMPDMSGEATFKKLDKIFPNRPVIFMSGYDDTAVKITKNNQKFLKKPFTINNLKDTIQQFNK